MSVLETVLLSLLGAALITYIIIAVVKTIKRKKHPKDEENE